MYHNYIQQSSYGTLFKKIAHYCRDHRAQRGLGLDQSEFTKSVIVFICLLYSIRE